MINIKTLTAPFLEEDISNLQVGDMIFISGKIFCGRDAVLPKIVNAYENKELGKFGLDLKGSLVFHTAVSNAGVGPTSSNKLEIESSIPMLSMAGVKIHLGKGKISDQTVEKLNEYNSVYAVIPPVTALLESKTLSRRVVAFENLGMEAFYELTVNEYPVIIAAAHGKSIY